MIEPPKETPLVEKAIRLDSRTLENRAAHLPKEMQELFVWLGCYLRDECSGEMDILCERFKEVGIHHDKTTWNRVLRGMWQRDADGKLTAAPIISQDKFIKALNALRSAARIKERGGRIPFVMTSVARMVWNAIDMRRTPDRVCKFQIIIGETGTGKSAALIEYQARNNHGLFTRVEAPETPSMSQFMLDLARSWGYSANPSYQKKKQYVIETVNARKVICVENVQRLYNPKFEGNQPIFNFLQKLQEDTNCTVVLTFTPIFERVFTSGCNKGFFEQFEGRAGGRRAFLRLPEYPPEEDVLLIAQAFGLREAEKHLDELVKISREPGRIRRLFEDLQNAKIEAEADAKPLTIGLVRATRGED